ncbi:MAG: hypothetical protein IKE30_02610 [Clostridia bacterium]|nr:hypothetical protein [Clostridia bacterium]
MKTIDTGGITWIEPVPGGTSEWYCGIGPDSSDAYDAEKLYRAGERVAGNEICLIHYPDGAVYKPVPRTEGTHMGKPVFLDGAIYFPRVDFKESVIRIFRFDCAGHEVTTLTTLPLAIVKNCWNLALHTSPLCLARQGNDGIFEIVWPERVSFALHPHEGFFLRERNRLYFTKWYEEGEGADYRYWEETIVRDLAGSPVEVLQGDVRVMPNGEMWHLK